MTEPTTTAPKIAFADFEIDTLHRRLLQNGETVALSAKAFDLLAFLASNDGRIVTKDEILDSVWEDKFVEESNLLVQISNLRKALGESPKAPRFLLTIPGKGYKFVSGVESNGFVVETHTVAELTIEQHDEITDSVASSRSKRAWGAAAAVLLVASAVAIGSLWRSPTQPAQAAHVRFEKVTANGKVTAAAMSPDGRFAIFARKDDLGQSLWLRQLETGSETRIVESKPLEYIGLTTSPDGQHIYASVFSKNEIDPSVVRIPVIGGAAQQLPNISTGSSITISPDGKRLAFTSSNNSENETLFGVADINGADPRILIRAKHESRYISMFQSSPAAWAPNGLEVALAIQEKQGGASQSAILLVDPDDGSESYLTGQRWKNVEDIAWLDDDRLIFIATEDDGPEDQIWILSRQTGDAKRVTNDLRSHNWLGVAAGKVLTVQVTASSSLRLAELDQAGNSIRSNEIFTASESIDELDWDPQGRVIYASGSGGTSEVWRMNADGSSPKQLTTNANVTFGLSVAADGSLVFASKQNGKRGIWMADAEGGSLTMLSDGGDRSPDISNDGKIVFHRGVGYAEGVFMVSGQEPTPRLLRERCYFPAISRDGNLAACYFMNLNSTRKWQIALIDTRSGETVRELELPVPIYERQIRFHPDGKRITQIYSAGQDLNLLLLPLDGSPATIIEDLGKGTSHVPEWTADGTKFLYPIVTEAQDVIMLTGF